MLCDRGGLILSRISTECFIVFPFTLKSAQFMTGVFPLIAGEFSDVMEELEFDFSFAGAEFRIVFFFNTISMGFIWGTYSLLDDL